MQGLLVGAGRRAGLGGSGASCGGSSNSCMTSADPAGSRPQPCSESRLALVREADSARKEQAELEVGGRRCLGWPPKGRLRGGGGGGGGGRGVAKIEGTYSFEDPKCSFSPSLVPHSGVLKCNTSSLPQIHWGGAAGGRGRGTARCELLAGFMNSQVTFEREFGAQSSGPQTCAGGAGSPLLESSEYVSEERWESLGARWRTAFFD